MAIKFKSVDSSNVAGVSYDAKELTLHVLFKDGRHYAYGGIAGETFAAMMDSPSIGSFIHRSIKPIATTTRRIA